MKRLLATTACLLTATGCTLMPEALQPHQLWKLNRQAPSGREDAFFSIRDAPVPTAPTASGLTESDVQNVMPTTDPFANAE